MCECQLSSVPKEAPTLSVPEEEEENEAKGEEEAAVAASAEYILAPTQE